MKTYLYPVCVYFDTVSGNWSNYGLANISYNYETGVLNCSTSHLSKFAMDYVTLNKAIIVNNTNTTDDSINSIFKTQKTYVYYLAVAVPAFITYLLIVLSCISFTKWVGGDPRMDKLSKKSYSFCSILCASCCLHHTLFSAFCGRQKANVHTTVPKSFKMLDFWRLFYAVLASLGLTFW